MHVAERAPYVCRRKHLFLPVTELLIPVVFFVAIFRVFPRLQVLYRCISQILLLTFAGVGGSQRGWFCNKPSYESNKGECVHVCF